MNKDLKFLLKRAFDAGTMYEATLSEECSFNEFIKYVESQQLSICDVVSSLPSKEEMEIKLDYLIENKPDAFNKYDEITFRFGFRTCFYWLDKKLRK